MVLLALLFVSAYFALQGAVLFVSAGRLDLPMFWTYLVVMAVPTVIAVGAEGRHNPHLRRDRTRRGGSDQDKLTIPIFLVSFLAHLVIAGLDVGRNHWSSSVPFVLQVVGVLGFGCGFGLVTWATLANRFYMPVVRLQEDRGQEVITTGPYRFVRHPGYVGWILFFSFSGVALGSWLSVLPLLLPVVAVIRRTVIEDRMLQGGLSGYADYARQVRYRLIPGLW
jgi:protein-S-isoprenylcysteine O-methyltransferase Ste14